MAISISRGASKTIRDSFQTTDLGLDARLRGNEAIGIEREQLSVRRPAKKDMRVRRGFDEAVSGAIDVNIRSGVEMHHYESGHNGTLSLGSG